MTLRFLVYGGLGNQLFQLAAAMASSEFLEEPFELIHGSARDKFGRQYELDCLGGEGFMTSSLPIYSWLGIGKFLPLLARHTLSQGPRFLIQTNQGENVDWGEFLGRMRPNSLVMGYFHCTDFAEKVGELLLETIMGAQLTPRESDWVSELTEKYSAIVHLRRGDFISSSESILGVGFAEQISSRIASLAETKPVAIMTDSPQAVEAERTQDGLDSLEVLRTEAVRPIALLHAMIGAPVLGVGNSTFSWWGGWARHRMGRGTSTFASSPFFIGSSPRDSLFLRSWSSVGPS